jgi:hypothetical protein
MRGTCYDLDKLDAIRIAFRIGNGHVTPLLKILQNQKLIPRLERPC